MRDFQIHTNQVQLTEVTVSAKSQEDAIRLVTEQIDGPGWTWDHEDLDMYTEWSPNDTVRIS
jgi:hypothetical protein